MAHKNWFGLVPHTTDSLLHWTTSVADAKAEAKVYRKAHNAIVNKGLQKELDILTRASYSEGSCDESDAHNEDL